MPPGASLLGAFTEEIDAMSMEEMESEILRLEAQLAGKGPVAALDVSKQSRVFTSRPRFRFAGESSEAA